MTAPCRIPIDRAYITRARLSRLPRCLTRDCCWGLVPIPSQSGASTCWCPLFCFFFLKVNHPQGEEFVTTGRRHHSVGPPEIMLPRPRCDSECAWVRTSGVHIQAPKLILAGCTMKLFTEDSPPSLSGLDHPSTTNPTLAKAKRLDFGARKALVGRAGGRPASATGGKQPNQAAHTLTTSRGG